jgi:hypothetical protein
MGKEGALVVSKTSGKALVSKNGKLTVFNSQGGCGCCVDSSPFCFGLRCFEGKLYVYTNKKGLNIVSYDGVENWGVPDVFRCPINTASVYYERHPADYHGFFFSKNEHTGSLTVEIGYGYGGTFYYGPNLYNGNDYPGYNLLYYNGVEGCKVASNSATHQFIGDYGIAHTVNNNSPAVIYKAQAINIISSTLNAINLTCSVYNTIACCVCQLYYQRSTYIAQVYNADTLVGEYKYDYPLLNIGALKATTAITGNNFIIYISPDNQSYFGIAGNRVISNVANSNDDFSVELDPETVINVRVVHGCVLKLSNGRVYRFTDSGWEHIGDQYEHFKQSDYDADVLGSIYYFPAGFLTATQDSSGNGIHISVFDKEGNKKTTITSTYSIIGEIGYGSSAIFTTIYFKIGPAHITPDEIQNGSKYLCLHIPSNDTMLVLDRVITVPYMSQSNHIEVKGKYAIVRYVLAIDGTIPPATSRILALLHADSNSALVAVNDPNSGYNNAFPPVVTVASTDMYTGVSAVSNSRADYGIASFSFLDFSKNTQEHRIFTNATLNEEDSRIIPSYVPEVNYE